MTKPKKVRVKTIFLFPNGMIAVTDQYGQQIPELQGKDTPELRAKLNPRITSDTELNGYII